MDPCKKFLPDYTLIPLAQALETYAGNLQERWKKTNGVIDHILAQYQKPKVLDLSLGYGYDSVHLLKQGYKVISNEIDPLYIPLAQRHAAQVGVKLNIRQEDWRKLAQSPQYQAEEFDVIFNLGNSFPNYLLQPEERQQALAGFWHLLKPGGVLIFDTRHFDYMLENRTAFSRDPIHTFHYAGKNTYLNSKAVQIFPAKIDAEQVHLCWKLDQTKQYAHLTAWPATLERTKRLIREVLPKATLEVLYDYQKIPPRHFDFVQYILQKRKKAVSV